MLDMIIAFVTFIKEYKIGFNVSFCRPIFNTNNNISNNNINNIVNVDNNNNK